MPKVPQLVPVEKLSTQAMTKMMAGRKLNRPAAALSVTPATKYFAPSRPVTFFSAVASVRIVMAGTMFIKPVGIASMDSLKEIRRRHQFQIRLMNRAMSVPQGRATVASVSDRAPWNWW